MFLLWAGSIKCLMPFTFLQITGVCKLLNQNSESLKTLEFIHCILSSASITEICSSLSPKSLQAHGIKHFSINTTKFLETNPSSVPVELVSFLSSGRCVYFSNLRPIKYIQIFGVCSWLIQVACSEAHKWIYFCFCFVCMSALWISCCIADLWRLVQFKDKL